VKDDRETNAMDLRAKMADSMVACIMIFIGCDTNYYYYLWTTIVLQDARIQDEFVAGSFAL
jgi:hypothetical protein